MKIKLVISNDRKEIIFKNGINIRELITNLNVILQGGVWNSFVLTGMFDIRSINPNIVSNDDRVDSLYGQKALPVSRPWIKWERDEDIIKHKLIDGVFDIEI